ncbi:MAG: hypothetical protein JSR19_02785 [Proteobacteria bacterium]|nr:hypothetical protein [Pseudomonadota bacterium]HQR03874.1 hypothetical protein [Rhodocyclaceae bacterium]
MHTCANDPLVCIDGLFLFIGSFLSDGFTLAGMATLLILLFMQRDRQKKRRFEAYSRTLAAYAEKHESHQPEPTWVLKDAQVTQPLRSAAPSTATIEPPTRQ